MKTNLRPCSGERAEARTIIIVLVFFLLGVGVGGLWFYSVRKAPRETPRPEPTPARPATGLSDATLAVLQRLKSTVDIRFYSLLDPSSTSGALRAFAGRVDDLLAAYRRAAPNGRIEVTRYSALSNTNADAAAADGVQAFNLGKGKACFLGIAVVCNGRKDTLPRLHPEWEQALQFDLSRAIARVSRPLPAPQPVALSPLTDAAAVKEVKDLIPNLGSVSVEEGTQILREAALKKFKAAAGETTTQMQAAQQRLAGAQTSGSATEQQAARQELRQLQAQQAEKLQQIAARLQAQINALKQLKKD